MSLSDADIEKFTQSPWVGAIAYQAYSLRDELRKINDEEYPYQACEIRDVLLCLVDHICEQFPPFFESQTVPGESTDFGTMRYFARVTHRLYSYIRYLRASVAQQTPPGIQLALTELTNLYFPLYLGEPRSLVRPQWHYDLAYVPFSLYVEDLIKLSDLDPHGAVGATARRDFLPKLWERRYGNSRPFPQRLAILSFPGLDTVHNVLFATWVCRKR